MDGANETVDVGDLGGTYAGCLMMSGDGDASLGVYRPGSYELRFRGDSGAEHDILELHEIHHKVLNDDTSWGSLVLFAAKHPGWGDLVQLLVDRSRIVHESFATFMSVSLARSRHTSADAVLQSYPAYVPLMERMERLLAQVPVGHRQELAATAIARFAMGAPVFDLALKLYPNQVASSDIRSSWSPDDRYSRVARVKADTFREASSAADAAFGDHFGRPFNELSLTETDETLDASWEVWEETFIAHLAANTEGLRSLPSVGKDGHLAAADQLVELAEQHGTQVELPRADPSHVLSDAESTQRILLAGAVALRSAPLHAAEAEIGVDVGMGAVLAHCSEQSQPALIVFGSRPSNLIRSFQFGPSDTKLLAARTDPLFAARLLVGDDRFEEGLILHASVPSPTALRTLFDAWPTSNISAICVTASCFADSGWQDTWAPTLSRHATIILVDGGLQGMAGEGRLLGSKGQVHAINLNLTQPGKAALVWQVEGHPHVMLVIGAPLTVNLFRGQLADLMGDRLIMNDSDWSEWLPTLRAVISTVLTTEPALRFDGVPRAEDR